MLTDAAAGSHGVGRGRTAMTDGSKEETQERFVVKHVGDPQKDSQTKKGDMRGKDRIATVPKKVERILENK